MKRQGRFSTLIGLPRRAGSVHEKGIFHQLGVAHGGNHPRALESLLTTWRYYINNPSDARLEWLNGYEQLAYRADSRMCPMSELIDSRARRIAALRHIIQHLHNPRPLSPPRADAHRRLRVR